MKHKEDGMNAMKKILVAGLFGFAALAPVEASANIVWGDAVRDRHSVGNIVWSNAVRDRHAVGNIVWGDAVRARHSVGNIVWGDAVRDRHAVGNIVWGDAVRARHAVGPNSGEKISARGELRISPKALDLNEGF